jgi:hypothetical protein
MAGQVFDFTTIDPLGVDCFLLLGIDETELIDPNGNSKPPFVFGAVSVGHPVVRSEIRASRMSCNWCLRSEFL